MPGLHHSPGLADINVCAGKREAGATALLERSKSQREEAHRRWQESRNRAGLSVASSDGSKFTEALEEQGHMSEAERRCGEGPGQDSCSQDMTLSSPPVETIAGAESTPQDRQGDPIILKTGSVSKMTAGCVSPRPHSGYSSDHSPQNTEGSMHDCVSRSRNLERDGSGLPPTPPAVTTQENGQNSAPAFADGVRNALSSKNSALSTTPVNSQLSPPTPDETPPTRVQKEITSPRSGATSEIGSPGGRSDSTPTLASTRSPLRRRRRTLQDSPPVSRGKDAMTDLEKHANDATDMNEREDNAGQHHSQPSPSVVDQTCTAATADLNDSVYKHIQKENIKRESIISNSPNAIKAGIVVPSAQSSPKPLKKRVKYPSLRNEATGPNTRQSSGSTDHALRHRRESLPDRRALEESPVFQNSTNIRQVSSPPVLGSNVPNMTAFTHAIMRKDLPDEKMAKIDERQMEPQGVSARRSAPVHSRDDGKDPLLPSANAAASPEPSEPTAPRLQDVSSSDGDDVPPHFLPNLSPFPSHHYYEIPGHEIFTQHRDTQHGEPTSNTHKRHSSAPVYHALPHGPPRVRPLSQTPRAPQGAKRSRPSPEQRTSHMQSPPLRSFCREARLENNYDVRRTSLGRGVDSTPPDHHVGSRHCSLNPSPMQSSPRHHSDPRFLSAMATPMSEGNMSDRTENVELLQASGVRLYLHNNDSLVVVQQPGPVGGRDHGSIVDPVHDPTRLGGGGGMREPRPQTPERPLGGHEQQPLFSATLDPPTPEIGTSNPNAHVDSPLTKPRPAPEPPRFHFIPPTPHTELDQMLSRDPTVVEASPNHRPDHQEARPRRFALSEMARRASDTLFGRASSTRQKPPPAHDTPVRPRHLSPMWRPNSFWHDSDSATDDSDPGDHEPDALPPGGDTSSLPDDTGANPAPRKRFGLPATFPRTMSKRLPGFTGTGGFLVGNTLGIDRHGTNTRRHYISTSTRRLTRRASADPPSRRNLPAVDSEPPSPSSPGQRFARAPAFWTALQGRKAEKDRLVRAQRVRENIGHRVFHG